MLLRRPENICTAAFRTMQLMEWTAMSEMPDAVVHAALLSSHNCTVKINKAYYHSQSTLVPLTHAQACRKTDAAYLNLL